MFSIFLYISEFWKSSGTETWIVATSGQKNYGCFKCKVSLLFSNLIYKIMKMNYFCNEETKLAITPLTRDIISHHTIVSL